MLYRDRVIPYDHSAIVDDHLRQDLAQIQTAAPFSWYWNSDMTQAYKTIYGQDALNEFLQTGRVCENTDPVRVGGTKYQLDGPNQNVWPCLEQPDSPVQPIPSPGIPAWALEMKKDLADIKAGITAILNKP